MRILAQQIEAGDVIPAVRRAVWRDGRKVVDYPDLRVDRVKVGRAVHVYLEGGVKRVYAFDDHVGIKG